MTPRAFLEACGWERNGGDYYFPSDGYPHLHLRSTGVGMETGNVGNNATFANKKAGYLALKPKISFVAISNGIPGGGRSFVSDGAATRLVGNAANIVRDVCGNENERTVSIGYELNYVLEAYGSTLNPPAL